MIDSEPRTDEKTLLIRRVQGLAGDAFWRNQGNLARDEATIREVMDWLERNLGPLSLEDRFLSPRLIGHLCRSIRSGDQRLIDFGLAVTQAYLKQKLGRSEDVILGAGPDTCMAWTISPFLLGRINFSKILEWIATGKPDQGDHAVRLKYLEGFSEFILVYPDIFPGIPLEKIQQHGTYQAAQMTADYLVKKLTAEKSRGRKK